MGYATLDEVKEYLQTEAVTDDVLLDRLIAAASASIDLFTGRVFAASADTTRLIDAPCYGPGEDGRTLWLDADLCQITSVTNGDDTAVAASAYFTEPRNVTPWFALRLKGSTSVSWTYEDDREGAIAITGRWAWSIEPPAAIVDACVRLVAWKYKQKDHQGDPGASTQSSDGVIMHPSRMPTDVRDLLTHYVRH